MTGEPRIEAEHTRYRIAGDVVDRTAHFLRQTGDEGHEGVVAWVGVLTGFQEATVTRAYVPEQVPTSGPEGVSVLVPERAITKLIAALGPEERVLIRVHSHPNFAYHSCTDDLNMVISHVGAISLVVPYFARNGISLPICSVNELKENGEWEELTVGQVERRFTIL